MSVELCVSKNGCVCLVLECGLSLPRGVLEVVPLPKFTGHKSVSTLPKKTILISLTCGLCTGKVTYI